jgi:NDP-sugar pyrophosphorylase family protein
MPELASLTAVILSGGKGTRLHSVAPGRQKVLVEVNGRPFVYYLLDWLMTAGIKKVVLCTGHLADQMTDTLGSSYREMHINYSVEQTPLGTAGALRQALPLMDTDTVLTMNGDSFCSADLGAFLVEHVANQAQASLLLVHVADMKRYGQVLLTEKNQIHRFCEKDETAGAGWINAGVYLMQREWIQQIPAGRAVSLEREIFPQRVGQQLYGYKAPARFLDIGTPQDYALAAEFFSWQEKQ